MPYLNIGGNNVYYELEGAGAPLVFIHGAMGTHTNWKNQAPVLAEKYQVCTVDLPGHGRSESGSEEISIDIYATAMVEVITRLELENPVVCGHSMGGAIALQLALDRGTPLGALVGVGTGAKLGVHPNILAAIQTNLSDAVDRIIGQWGFSNKTERAVMEAVKRETLEIKTTIAVADWEACDGFDCRVRLQEEGIQLPTLMIVGEEDQLTPVWYSEYLVEQIPGATMETIPDAGHYVMLEQPERVNRALLAFLERTL